MIARDGVAATTTRNVAREAGVPLGLVHYWFSGKEELLEEVVGGLLEQLKSVAATAYAQDTGDPEQDLLASFRAAFEVVSQDDPGRQLAVYELTTWALRAPDQRELARRQYTAYRTSAYAVMAPWLARTGRDFPGGAEALARFVVTLFDGVVLAWLADPEGTRPDEVFTLASQLIAGALRPRPAESPDSRQ